MRIRFIKTHQGYPTGYEMELEDAAAKPYLVAKAAADITSLEDTIETADAKPKGETAVGGPQRRRTKKK